MNCEISGHKHSQILGACFNRLCQKNRAFCEECILINHKNHTKDLKVNNQLDGWRQAKFQFISQLNNLRKQFQVFNKAIAEIIKVLENQEYQKSFDEQSSSTFEKLIQILRQIDLIEEVYSKKLMNIFQEVNGLNQELKKIKLRTISSISDNKITQQEQQKPSQIQLNQEIEQNDIWVKEYQQQYLNLLKDQAAFNQPQVLNIKFSQKLKSKHIEVSSDSLKAISQNDFSFILCEPEIPKTGTWQFCFQNIETQSVIHLGIGNKEILESNDYNVYSKGIDVLSQKIGHGAYLISNYGTTHSHTELKMNDQVLESYNFMPNEFVSITVDMDNSLIMWENKNNQKKAFMKFDSKMTFHPCVALYYGEQAGVEKAK